MYVVNEDKITFPEFDYKLQMAHNANGIFFSISHKEYVSEKKSVISLVLAKVLHKSSSISL